MNKSIRSAKKWRKSLDRAAYNIPITTLVMLNSLPNGELYCICFAGNIATLSDTV